MSYPYYSYGYNPLAHQLFNAQQQIQNSPMRVILISNDDEVKAIPADNNGNPTFFYNKSGNKVFIKQVNPQTMEAHIQSFKAELPEQPTQPDKDTQYRQTVIDGINGLYREFQALKQTITTQPPIMDEPPVTKGRKSNAE